MGKYFGTDGFRGEANTNLTVEHAFKIGKFLGANSADGRARIVIGKDTRLSSYMFEYALVAGLTSVGADAYLLHVTTTPSVSFVTRSEGFDAGIMISASHNPYTDNGIKIINRQGEKMSDEVTDKIEKYLDSPDNIPLATGERIGRTVDHVLGRNRYTGYIISLARHSYKGLKVGLDAANGSAWMLAKSVFDALGAKTHVIGNDPSGVNINLGCGSTHIEALCEIVRREGLDVGFAFDGDADRCLAVDEGGRVISGEGILYAAAKYLKSRGALEGDTVVTTVMSNLGLSRRLEREGIAFHAAPVGDRFVAETMKRVGATLGGEPSGHVIFSDVAATGDGLLTALSVLSLLTRSGTPLSALAAELARYPAATADLPLTPAAREAFATDGELSALRERAAALLGTHGRLLIRPSGTEPRLRVLVEADNQALLESTLSLLTKEAERILEKY